MSRPKRFSKLTPNNIGGFIKRNLLTFLTIIGVLSAGFSAVVIRQTVDRDYWTPRRLTYLSFPGDIFLNMLKCLIVPLLISSITSAIGSLDVSMSGKIALRAISYYFVTTICAVILGIALVTTIQPGKFSQPDDDGRIDVPDDVLPADTLLDLIRNVFPQNIIQATVAQYQTKLSFPKNITKYENLAKGMATNLTNVAVDSVTGLVTQINETSVPVFNRSMVPLEEYDIGSRYTSTTNVLGIVMFSIVLGITIGKMHESGKILQDFFLALSGAMMLITSWVIWISPIGVYFLVLKEILKMNSIATVISQLGLYFMTVMLGLFIHGFGTIALLFFLGTRKLSYPYVFRMAQVLATAFGTGSSSATMPITINCLDNLGIDPRVTRFVIPVGATINMDGTALYEAVAALFIAQMRKVPYSFGTIIGVSITATAASIGAAGIPQAGLVTMVMVLDTVGLPSADVSLIFAVDWLLDRFRTTINVMCDALGAILINSLSKKDLQLKDDQENAEPHELLELGAAVHDCKE